MSEHTARNLSIIRARLPKTVRRSFDEESLAKLNAVADEMIKRIEEDPFPYETGNLMESTAVAVYVEGVVKVFRTSAKPDRLQEWNGQWYRGKDQLSLALAYGAFQNPTGVSIVLYCSQPYANWLNTEHPNWTGFFRSLSDGMSFMVHESFRTISEDIQIGNFKPMGGKSSQTHKSGYK